MASPHQQKLLKRGKPARARPENGLVFINKKYLASILNNTEVAQDKIRTYNLNIFRVPLYQLSFLSYHFFAFFKFIILRLKLN